MNKAITEGLVLMPPRFADGLDVWSSEDGTPGSATYDGATNAAFVPADQDFGGALELVKTQSTQKLRWMGQTPILPGCYLRITARIKAVSGAFPSVRIAGWAADSGGAHVGGLGETGPAVTLDTYGEVAEVSAIVGTGNRGGVDMTWSLAATYGHFGLDLTGANGGVVRIDDIVVEDITEAFLRDMLSFVDVRDYGAVGDGVTDDSAAFAAADTDANGREVLVPAGDYFIGSDLTIDNKARFDGTLTMAPGARLSLIHDFGLPVYIDALGDEVEAFRKAFQALLTYSDSDTLDMGGRRIDLDAPIDMAAAAPGNESYLIRRVIRNGKFQVTNSAAWDPDVVTSTGDYSTGDKFQLTNVAGIAQIQVGSLVEGTGVGREVYVRAVNVAASSLTLSQALHGAPATQSYTFTRHKYILDFSGFANVRRLALQDIEFQAYTYASMILLPPDGQNWQITDCYFIKPKNRGITSPGRCCQDLHIDRCQFISAESALPATSRQSIAFNINANDAKIRDNRFQHMGMTGVIHGGNHIVSGNHLFQGDGETLGPRLPGFVFTLPSNSVSVTGNYIDNCYIEWTNEYDADPDFQNEYSFGAMTITGNTFLAGSSVAPWFKFIVIKPYGAGHFVSGFHVNQNIFKAQAGDIDRVEGVDESIAALDYWRFRNITFERNTFNGVTQRTHSPVALEFQQNTAQATWTLDPSGYLPFGGNARTVTAVVVEGDLLNGSNAPIDARPSVRVNQGTENKYVQLLWSEACTGTAHVTVRVDKPI